MKTRMDFRLEENTKRLIEMAAAMQDMTVSGYINFLVNQCLEKIIDDIAFGFTAKSIVKSVLGEEEEKEMSAIVRLHLVNKIIEQDSENLNIYSELIHEWKQIFSDYMKSKD